MTLAATLTDSNKQTPGTTVTGLAIGTASADRVVIIGCACTPGEITSVTIGGIAASWTEYSLASFGFNNAFAWGAALVPTGTTATVVFNGAVSGVTIDGAFAVTGGSQHVPSFHIEDASFTTGTTSIQVPAGGVILALGVDDSGADPTLSWTVGLSAIGSQFFQSPSAGLWGYLASATAQTVTCTFAGASVPATFSASFGLLPTAKPANQNRLLLGVG